MFMQYSLCPGGAMMMCESVSEFDPVAPDNITPEVVEKVRAELMPQVEVYDPVDKLTQKLLPYYEQVKELMNTELEPDSGEEAYKLLDKISDLATRLADRMRICILKQAAMNKLCTDDTREVLWEMEEFRNNMGFFMKNANRIRQMGYDRCRFTVSILTQMYEYDIQRLLNVYCTESLDELVDYPLDLENIRTAMSNQCGAYLNCFASMADMYDCIFFDKERLQRLEEKRERDMTMDDMLGAISYAGEGPRCVSDRNSEPKCLLVVYLSRKLRMIKQKCYDMQCKLMDGENPDVTAGDMHKDLRKLISTTVDLFYVPAMVLYSTAYSMRNTITKRNAVTAYVAETLAVMNAGRSV